MYTSNRDITSYIESGIWKCDQSPLKKFYIEQLPNGKWGVFEEHE